MRRSILLLTFLLTCVLRAHAQSSLDGDFQNPPHANRPHTWWHWMNGNVTKTGITKDLEAMKAIGLGGAQIFNVSEGIPKGPVLYNSDEWRELVVFAAKEAERLGLELCIHNCAGWSSSGAPWVTPEFAMRRLTWSETTIDGDQSIARILTKPESRLDSYSDIAVIAFPTPEQADARVPEHSQKIGLDAPYGLLPKTYDFPANGIVRAESIVDLTSSMNADGRLTWNVPPGKWTVLRIGHTPTGAVNAPSPDSGRGLEVDKFSRTAFDVFWNGGMQKLLDALGPLAGKSLNNCLIDSYEVGAQNWSKDFAAEFKKRRGYEIGAHFAALAGRVVDSVDHTERVLFDFRRTIADLFAENYYDYFAEKCHAAGLLASIEPYDGPYECLMSGRSADIPMGEFWAGGGMTNSCKLAASVAHTNGRALVGAESFTAFPSLGRWLNTPANLKSIGDLLYSSGINRFIIHRYAHQPWDDVLPGMTMGQWGTHFERTTTWWNMGGAWISYLARCQTLLQKGTFQADICYLLGPGVPHHSVFDTALKERGFDYDTANIDTLLRKMTVKDGRITLPDGMNYRVLALAEDRMLPADAVRKIGELAEAGATIIGPRTLGSPHAQSGDVQGLAEKIWGDLDGTSKTERTLGRGRIVWGKSAEDVLRAGRIGPDVIVHGQERPFGAWIHRKIAESDVYFVSNQKNRSQTLELSFRIEKKVPEFFDAVTGKTCDAPMWRSENGRTIVPVTFEPSGSIFVVFRKDAANIDPVAKFMPDAAERAEKPKDIVVAKARYEAEDGSSGADVTEKVRALLRSGDDAIEATNANFGDPAYMKLKRLLVTVSIDGKEKTAIARENETLTLLESAPEGPRAAFDLRSSPDHGLTVTAFANGRREWMTAAKKTLVAEAKNVPAPIEITGPWSLTFPPKLGAPPTAEFAKLASWTESTDPGIRYFSGTVTYTKSIDLPADRLGDGKVIELDLGVVKEMAEVIVNGKNLGVLWKPPFRLDVTRAMIAGKNTLEVKVVNLWVNRLIGDEQFPDDCEWDGIHIKKWPAWFLDHTPRPSSNRLLFTTWKHWQKTDTPLESGLLGPVVLRSGVEVVAHEAP